jgi:hypothetical protein
LKGLLITMLLFEIEYVTVTYMFLIIVEEISGVLSLRPRQWLERKSIVMYFQSAAPCDCGALFIKATIVKLKTIV